MHNLRVIVVMVIRLSVDHWIRQYNSQYLSHFVSMVMTLVAICSICDILSPWSRHLWGNFSGWEFLWHVQRKSDIVKQQKTAPRDRFAFSKALLGWCCSCSIGQCALIPLLSYSGSRRSVSYRSYRKRSEKLEVFLEGWVTSSHLTSFFSVHPHGSNLRCFKTEVVWAAIWWGTFRTASHSQRAHFTQPGTFGKNWPPLSPENSAQHEFSWPIKIPGCWLWCCNLPPLL